MRMLLTGAYTLAHGKLVPQDVLVEDGRIVSSFGKGVQADRVLSLHGRLVVPGLVDVHVHLREPGFSYKETVLAGTRAAARGGYTTVCAMPNLNPAPDTPEHLAVEEEIIRRDACVRVVPYGCITLGQKGAGELTDMAALGPRVAGFSDDGRGVQSESLMRQAMERCKAAGSMIVAHCEDMSLIPAGGAIHAGSYAAAHGIPGIPSESEWGQIARDLRLARETGCPYHVCHISCKESVALIRQAKAEGVNVTCETGPHYLLLSQDDLQDEGRFKMNPPLRDRADREALLEGLADGTIDMIATDHAPHGQEEKAKGLRGSVMGIAGLETAFPLLYTHLVQKGLISLEKLMELMSGAPRRRFGFTDGGILPGQRAELAVLDLDKRWNIDPERFLSLGRSTPFTGWEVQGDCVMTLYGERVAYKEEESV